MAGSTFNDAWSSGKLPLISALFSLHQMNASSILHLATGDTGSYYGQRLCPISFRNGFNRLVSYSTVSPIRSAVLWRLFCDGHSPRDILHHAACPYRHLASHAWCPEELTGSLTWTSDRCPQTCLQSSIVLSEAFICVLITRTRHL